ncbi:MAG: hypothetical protein AB8G86_26200 [Saprospiraceae bacterium]
MRKLIWMLSLSILPYSFVFATTLFDCPDATIKIEEGELKIANITKSCFWSDFFRFESL